MPVNDKRPVNLDISTIRLPLAALASITHRITGVLLFVGIAGLLYLFDLSMAGETGFDRARSLLATPLARALLWVVLSGLAYHTVAGVRHLLLDVGIGESREGGPRGAATVFVLSALLIVLLGVWLW